MRLQIPLTDSNKRNECPFRYQGQYEDQETGLYYNMLE